MKEHRTTRHLAMEELERLALGEGSLPRPRREHLHGCDRCRRELASVESLHDALSGLPYHAPSAGFADAVLSRVELPAPWYVRLLSRDWTRWAGFSAGALALAAIGFWTWLFTRSGVALRPVLSVVVDWARTAFWDLVVGAGRLVYDTGIGPAAADVATSLTPMTTAALLATLAVLASLASVAVVKLMELPVPAVGSARRT